MIYPCFCEIITYYLVVVIDARLEHALVNTAYGANPIIRNVLKSGSGCDAMLRITYCGIIRVATGIAKIFLHSIVSPFLNGNFIICFAFDLAEVSLQQTFKC